MFQRPPNRPQAKDAVRVKRSASTGEMPKITVEGGDLIKEPPYFEYALPGAFDVGIIKQPGIPPVREVFP